MSATPEQAQESVREEAWHIWALAFASEGAGQDGSYLTPTEPLKVVAPKTGGEA